VPSEAEQATTNKTNQEANAAEMTMLTSLQNAGIISPEEVRQIFVNKYDEYNFPEEIPDTAVSAMDYAAGIDTSMLDVPNDTSKPSAQA